ncbi:preprotein translocase subunit YajC [Planctomycetota bacterium]
MNNIYILAQAGGEETSTISSTDVTDSEQTTTQIIVDSNAPAGQQSKPSSSISTFLFMGLMLVVMYLFLFRGPRKKQQQHKQMVQSLQKNDRIRTIGGIIGTVVDIKDDEVTVKVDEANNTKIKIIASAIGKNVSKEG